MSSIAVLGIAQVAAESLLQAMVMGRAEIAPIRVACEGSVYWPEFCELVQHDQVSLVDVADNPIVAECVIGWAKQAVAS